MTWATKVRIIVVAILFGIAIFLFCQWLAIQDLKKDLAPIPKLMDEVQHEINWRKI